MKARILRALALPIFLAGGTRLGAQGIRITGTSLGQYVELRPVIEDSIPDSLSTGAGLVRSSPVGIVACPVAQTRCYFYRSLAREHTIPLTQDLEANVWGLGQGVTAYAHLRARANAGGVSELWTRAGDRFTALAAYVEIDRDRWFGRAGRQWLTSQLGLNNFDGVSLGLRAPARLVVEAYAGRSLIQGLSESLTSSTLAAADVLPPDVQGIIIGTTVRWRATPTLALGAEYQREIRSDRAGFYSERIAVDGAFAVAGTSVTGEVQADLASTAFNEVRVRASRPLPWGMSGGIEAVHSTPFFPLWTIWGVFAPVGFNEARADARWESPSDALSLTLSGGYRRYQDTHTGVGFLALRDDGWTVIAGGTWRIRPSWEANGSYRRDIGFGASKSDGNAGVRWQPADDTWLGITGSATQSIFEFRLANGYLTGLSADGAISLASELRLAAQFGVFRQIAANTPSTTVNWSQRRALVRLEWTVGRDPGMRASRSTADGRPQ